MDHMRQAKEMRTRITRTTHVSRYQRTAFKSSNREVSLSRSEAKSGLIADRFPATVITCMTSLPFPERFCDEAFFKLGTTYTKPFSTTNDLFERSIDCLEILEKLNFEHNVPPRSHDRAAVALVRRHTPCHSVIISTSRRASSFTSQFAEVLS